MPNNNDGGIISFKAGYKDPVTGEFKRDLFWERMDAESGDPEAMIQMGFAYMTGDGVERDPVKAVEYYRMAAELDEPVGQYNMGIQCARGEGIARDFAAAIAWMEKARDNGDEDAPGQLKILKDAPEIEKAAYAGDAEAQARFSTLLANYPSEENKKESFEMARRSVEQGCPRGYHCLGTRYDYGVGVEKDPVKAAELYRQGAELGSPECQYCYAVCFKSGSGVPQDDDAALEWAIKAAEQGHGAAAASISLESGSHPQPIMPVERIIGYLLKAEEKEPGDVRVAAQLAVQYINLYPSDFEKSIYWYERAAELGDENAAGMAHVYRYRQRLIDEGKLPADVDVMTYIGYLQENDLIAEAFGREPAEREPDYDIDALLEGVEAENPDAIKAYAFACFLEGEEVYDHGVDKVRAMSLLEELSETDPQAAGIIGLIYWQGRGVQQDDELAEKWLSKAVEGGETDLEEQLESVRENLGPMPDYECKLTNTKKGERKERSERVRVGDKV
ncbi:MAG: sel1 repeat family protein, partial [Oscillospiraceae bacterium]|nr:sel1 repeat family protein [Oscillospiraceae bacterium]